MISWEEEVEELSRSVGIWGMVRYLSRFFLGGIGLSFDPADVY